MHSRGAGQEHLVHLFSATVTPLEARWHVPGAVVAGPLWVDPSHMLRRGHKLFLRENLCMVDKCQNPSAPPRVTSSLALGSAELLHLFQEGYAHEAQRVDVWPGRTLGEIATGVQELIDAGYRMELPKLGSVKDAVVPAVGALKILAEIHSHPVSSGYGSAF